MAEYCANFIIERGGKRLMDTIKNSDRKIDVFSTKSLTEQQLRMFNDGLKVESDDAIKISLNRISPILLKSTLKNVVITSQNAVEAILKSVDATELQFKNIYCVGRRTKRLIAQKSDQ